MLLVALIILAGWIAGVIHCAYTISPRDVDRLWPDHKVRWCWCPDSLQLIPDTNPHKSRYTLPWITSHMEKAFAVWNAGAKGDVWLDPEYAGVCSQGYTTLEALQVFFIAEGASDSTVGYRSDTINYLKICVSTNVVPPDNMEDYFDWVFRHEIGHTFGFYHEHQRPDRNVPDADHDTIHIDWPLTEHWWEFAEQHDQQWRGRIIDEAWARELGVAHIPNARYDLDKLVNDHEYQVKTGFIEYNWNWVVLPADKGNDPGNKLSYDLQWTGASVDADSVMLHSTSGTRGVLRWRSGADIPTNVPSHGDISRLESLYGARKSGHSRRAFSINTSDPSENWPKGAITWCYNPITWWDQTRGDVEEWFSGLMDDGIKSWGGGFSGSAGVRHTGKGQCSASSPSLAGVLQITFARDSKFNVTTGFQSSGQGNRMIFGLQTSDGQWLCDDQLKPQLAHMLGHVFGFNHEQNRPDAGAHFKLNCLKLLDYDQFVEDDHWDPVPKGATIGTYIPKDKIDLFPGPYHTSTTGNLMPRFVSHLLCTRQQYASDAGFSAQSYLPMAKDAKSEDDFAYQMDDKVDTDSIMLSSTEQSHGALTMKDGKGIPARKEPSKGDVTRLAKLYPKA